MPWLPGTSTVSPAPAHRSLVWLPLNLSQPGQMHCSRLEGKDAVEMLIWLVFFFREVCRNDLGKGNGGEGGDHR